MYIKAPGAPGSFKRLVIASLGVFTTSREEQCAELRFVSCKWKQPGPNVEEISQSRSPLCGMQNAKTACRPLGNVGNVEPFREC